MISWQMVLVVVFAGATIVNLSYWIFVFSKLAFHKSKLDSKKESVKEDRLVSIIICAKNEEENLEKFLPRILSQTYRSVEFIVVNDGSTDKTLEVLQEYHKRYPTFRIINFSNTKKRFAGKKEALLKGIEAASGEIVLLTDADCEPISEEWAAEMNKVINQKHELGLGYSPYRKYPGMLNRWIRFEAVYTAVQYFSFALAGMPYMGVGRNLIYKRKLIEKVNGFHEHIQIASGDDDLFVNAVSNSNNTAIQLTEKSFVVSEPCRKWNAYYRQKSRHMTTGRHYQKKHQLLLGGLAGSHWIHYTGGIALLHIKLSIIFVFSLYVVRMLVVVYLCSRILRKLQDPSLLIWIPLFDFLLIFYNLLFLPKLFKRKTQQWL